MIVLVRQMSPRAVGDFECRFIEEEGEDRRILITRSNYRFIDSQFRRWPIRAGRIVDGASIPRAFWTLIGGPLEGDHRIPAILHDEAYASHKRAAVPCTKADADWMFYEALRYYGVGRIKARTLWLAVKTFGGRAWRKKGDSGQRVGD